MSEPIDLHTHSRASDGSESPAEVIAAAARAGIHTVALTDHDTVSGWAEATEAATALGVGFIPGIELSTQVFDEQNDFEPPSGAGRGDGEDSLPPG
jgi:predicted metal-dependent phosphoesterase TrpH